MIVFNAIACVFCAVGATQSIRRDDYLLVVLNVALFIANAAFVVRGFAT